jgi:uncharacterized protein (TIGR02001 family)
MLNKKLSTVAITSALLVGIGATSAQAVEVSGNVALTSDYKFRGISQSDESPAIQGGFDVTFEPGFYIGTWGSSVDFDTNGDGYDGSLELDGYAGWASSIGDTDFGVDVGYIYYGYPGDGSPNGNYQEFYVKGSWRDLVLGVAYSDDYYAGTDEFWYVSADYSLTVLEDFSVGLHVGYNMLEDDGGFLSVQPGKTKAEDAYTDYSVSVSYEWVGLEFAVAYVGTDLDDEDVFDTDWADSKAVFSISKSL